MFSFFKKKKFKRFNASKGSTNERITLWAANIIELSLTLFRSARTVSELNSMLEDKKVRGYLIGFIDCALQRRGEPIYSDEEFFRLLHLGHHSLLKCDDEYVNKYLIASLKMHGDPEFDNGQLNGGEEFDRLLAGKSSSAATLLSYLMQ